MLGILKCSCLIVGWICDVLIEIAGIVGGLTTKNCSGTEWAALMFWCALFIAQVLMAWCVQEGHPVG